MAKRVVILSGPSGVGKGPLLAALRRYYADMVWAELILCTSRSPRLKRNTGMFEVHGRDYYFLPRGLFSQLDPQRFIVAPVRSVLQAIDLEVLQDLLSGHDLVIGEVHPSLARPLVEWLRANRPEVRVVSVFLLPVSPEEVQTAGGQSGKAPEQVVYELMKVKLRRRGEDPPSKVEERARAAWGEIQMSRDYDFQLVNHAGEDDIQAWTDPLAEEPRRVLDEFVAIAKGRVQDASQLKLFPV